MFGQTTGGTCPLGLVLPGNSEGHLGGAARGWDWIGNVHCVGGLVWAANWLPNIASAIANANVH